MIKTDIANLTLVRLGVSKKLGNVDTDNSVESRTILSVFDAERDYILRDFAWPFATAYATLALVVGSSDAPVNYDWIFAYGYPTDCWKVRRIVTPAGQRDTHPPRFKIGRGTSGRLIYTNQDLAQIEYTVKVTDPDEFDPIFASALAWRIGMSVAAPLSRIQNVIQTCTAGYEMDLQRAQAAALNESQQGPAPEAEWIQDRNFGPRQERRHDTW